MQGGSAHSGIIVEDVIFTMRFGTGIPSPTSRSWLRPWMTMVRKVITYLVCLLTMLISQGTSSSCTSHVEIWDYVGSLTLLNCTLLKTHQQVLPKHGGGICHKKSPGCSGKKVNQMVVDYHPCVVSHCLTMINCDQGSMTSIICEIIHYVSIIMQVYRCFSTVYSHWSVFFRIYSFLLVDDQPIIDSFLSFEQLSVNHGCFNQWFVNWRPLLINLLMTN